MNRKVNRVGKNTLTVSLPNRWVKSNNIQKGDMLKIHERAQELTIIPEKAGKNPAIPEIDLSGADSQFIRITLSNAYRRGYDEIKVRFGSLDDYQAIYTVCNDHFLGFEVTKKGQHSCTIENVMEPYQEKYDMILRRIFLIIKDSLSLIHEDRQKENDSILSFLRQQFSKVDQFSNFCMRSLNKNFSDASSFHYMLLYDLLVMQSEMVHMYEWMAKKKIHLEKSTIDFVQRLEKTFTLFYESFFRGDLASMNKLNSEAKQLLYREAYGLLGRSEGNQAIVDYHLAVISRMIILAISPTLSILR